MPSKTLFGSIWAMYSSSLAVSDVDFKFTGNQSQYPRRKSPGLQGMRCHRRDGWQWQAIVTWAAHQAWLAPTSILSLSISCTSAVLPSNCLTCPRLLIAANVVVLFSWSCYFQTVLYFSSWNVCSKFVAYKAKLLFYNLFWFDKSDKIWFSTTWCTYLIEQVNYRLTALYTQLVSPNLDG